MRYLIIFISLLTISSIVYLNSFRDEKNETQWSKNNQEDSHEKTAALTNLTAVDRVSVASHKNTTRVDSPELSNIENSQSISFYKNSDEIALSTSNLEVENFSIVLDYLSSKPNELSMEWETTLGENLSKIEELAGYNYRYNCGDGVCGIELTMVPKDAADNIRASINKNVQLGTSFAYTLSVSNEFVDIRYLINGEAEEDNEEQINRMLNSVYDDLK